MLQTREARFSEVMGIGALLLPTKANLEGAYFSESILKVKSLKVWWV